MSVGATKKDQVLERIRDLIIEGEYRPGSRLYIEEVAEQLDVSPTPVREALRQLETEGLVASKPHRGVVVTDWTFDRIHETLLIRRVLEKLSAELAAPRLTDADLDTLGQVHTEGVEALESSDYRRLRRLHRDFHGVIYRAAGAPQLTTFLQMLWARLPFGVIASVPDLLEHSLDGHDRLIQAFRAHDAQRAGELMEQHMTTNLECWMRWARMAGHLPPELPGSDGARRGRTRARRVA
jgi:DNA-binding GntR family transcriptional regulator